MRPRSLILGLVFLALAGSAGWYWLAPGHSPEQTQGRRGQDAGSAIAVVTGTAAQRDVDIFLDGLGSVAAYNTVTIRSRVDGHLQQLMFREGQDVHAGDVLAQIDARPFQAALQQMQAQLQRDQAQLANARLDLDRFVKLGQYASRQNVDTQRMQVAQFEAATASDQAQIENAKVQLDYTTIRSPIDGRTGIRQIDAGNIVHANDVTGLVVITQLKPISVLFTLAEQSLPRVNQEIAQHQLAAIAFDRDNQTKLGQGKVELVDNVIDQQTGTIKVKATFPNDQLSLWPGQFVNVRLRLTTRKDGIVVPAQVVQRGPQGAYAFVIKPDNTVEMRPIKVAQIEDGVALIDEGLAPGERVVVEGQYKLQPGSRVSVTPAGTSDAPTSDSGAAPKADRRPRT
jgi:membrane fusion protein, multidrug efflux system